MIRLVIMIRLIIIQLINNVSHDVLFKYINKLNIDFVLSILSLLLGVWLFCDIFP